MRLGSQVAAARRIAARCAKIKLYNSVQNKVCPIYGRAVMYAQLLFGLFGMSMQMPAFVTLAFAAMLIYVVGRAKFACPEERGKP